MPAANAIYDVHYMNSLPPLPQISQPEIAVRVSTHQSLNTDANQDLELAHGGGNDFRRDALLGDALLGHFLTVLLLERYPQLTPGAATIILSVAWSNATLAGLATAYGLHEGLRAAAPQLASLRYSSKVQATMFEAYLYGIYLNTGGADYQPVKTFIEALFGPLLDIQRQHFAAQHRLVAITVDSFQDRISKLNTLCHLRGIAAPQYLKVRQVGPLHAREFTVRVVVDGATRGYGTGSSKREAKHGAAQEAFTSMMTSA